jgi:tRNA threonylcarbamoyladenosine biosynthesis protein TsaE
MLKIISKSPKDTKIIGEKLSIYLFAGAIVCLSGDLGAGKTAFVQGMGKGLGIDEHITSPTYTIINEYYSGRIPLYHFDVYRLGSSDEMLELGCDEYFFGDGISVVEWADNVEDIIPSQRLWIKISLGESLEEREIMMEARGRLYEAILKGMGE